MKKRFLITIAIILFIIFGTLGLFKGIERIEQNECIKWQEQSKIYKNKGWYSTDWQKEQCLNYGIELEQ